jgi:hypothetical protein
VIAAARLLAIALLGAMACFLAPCVTAQTLTLTVTSKEGTRT